MPNRKNQSSTKTTMCADKASAVILPEGWEKSGWKVRTLKGIRCLVSGEVDTDAKPEGSLLPGSKRLIAST